MSFTEYKDHHKQDCPKCKIKLITLQDYLGGGSHYWYLFCTECGQEFQYDTYRFELEEINLFQLDKKE